MSKAVRVTETLIENRIYFIRDQKIMLDYDIAEMYMGSNQSVETICKKEY